MNIVPFNFDAVPVRTVSLDDGEPLFVAKDVAIALGYGNPRQAVIDHCKKAKSLKDIGVQKRDPLQNQQLTLDPQTKLIPESDVYRMVMRSNLSDAERFQDWVVEEVLPQIRKTGSYQASAQSVAANPIHVQSNNPVVVERIDALAMSRVELELSSLFGVPQHLAQVEAVKSVRNNLGVDISYLLAHAPAQNQIADDNVWLEPTELAKVLGFRSAKVLNRLLETLGMQTKEPIGWEPTDEGREYCQRHHWSSGTKSGYNLKWSRDLVEKRLSNFTTYNKPLSIV